MGTWTRRCGHAFVSVLLLSSAYGGLGDPAKRALPAAAPAPLDTAFGRLRLIDPLPCYELVFTGDYRLEELERPASAAHLRPPPAAWACTGFSARQPDGSPVFGRNLDWFPNPALVLVTRPKGRYASLSLVDISYLGYSAARTPLDAPRGLADAWRLPFDGMNERGLTVGMMAVDHAEGPMGSGRPRVGELGLMRILLDRAATVKEALALMERYEVDLTDPPLHYLLADRTGDGAVVEYLGGRLRVFRSPDPWLVSTNFLLGEVAPADRDRACWRYAAVSARLAASRGVLGAPEALGLLEAVAVPRTRWSAVYEPGALRLTLALDRRFRNPYRWSLGR